MAIRFGKGLAFVFIPHTTVSDQEWHHVAWRKSGSGTSSWDKFLDGIKYNINPAINFTLPGFLFYARVFMGENLGSEFNGSIARVAIWDQAVTDEELKQIAAGGHANAVHPNGLLQYWPITGDTSPEPNNGIAGLTHPTLIVNGTLPGAE